MSTPTSNEKIELRPLRSTDAGIIFNCLDTHREQLRQWLPFVDLTLKLEDTQEFVDSVLCPDEGPEDRVYLITYAGKFAGLIGYRFTDSLNKKTEIGYWLHPEFQGKGIMTYCTKTLIHEAFYKWDFNRLTLNIAVGNHKSRAIALRLGFQLEGIAREAEWLSSGFADIEMYALLRKDFLKP